MHSQNVNTRVISFSSQKEIMLIKEPDYQNYQRKLKANLKNGYEILLASCVYKKTRFGGAISYFAELEK